MAYQSSASSSSSGPSGFQFLNSPFGDTTYTKVFVGGLAWETQSDTMRRYFEQFGDILEAVVITDKNTGRSKGYGFVTFRESEAAARACVDPAPVIDGRRANCNLASLRRPKPPMPYGRPRPATPYVGSMQAARGAYVRGYGYQQPFSYNYQQGMMYPPYGYATYGPEYAYSQAAYNPYAGQQYLQVYGVPGAINSAVYPYGQLGQTIPGGQGYPSIHGYTMPAQQLVQFGGPSFNAVTTSPVPLGQATYPTGMVASLSAQPHFIVSAPPQYMQGSGSEQTAGFPQIAAGLRAAELLLNWRASDLSLAIVFCILQVIHSFHAHQSLSHFRWQRKMEDANCLSLFGHLSSVHLDPLVTSPAEEK